MTPSKNSSSTLALHEGQALMALAQTYDGLPRVILELVQNALDQLASHVTIDVNYDKRVVAVRDNGSGIDKGDFEIALMSIGKTIKERGKLGQYGRGMISPLGKCEVMKFTSTPRRDPHAYLTWTFVTAELANREQLGSIPVQPQPQLWFGNTGANKIGWRTEVRMEKFTADKQINAMTIQSLKEEICTRYGVVMRRKKVSVTIKITDADGNRQDETFEAPDYAGQSLKVHTTSDEISGKTTFRLFIARADRKYRSKGKIVVGITGDDFRTSMENMLRSIPDNLRVEMGEAVEALNSGYFEGEIINSRITKNPGRESFVYNDQLVAFCLTVGSWFESIGHNYYKEIQEARQNGRLQDLGRRSLAVFEQLLDTPEGAFLRELIARVKKGTIATGAHTAKKTTEVTDFKSARALVATGDSANGGHDTGKAPGFEKADDTPLLVAGPEGRKRAVVKSNSLGITLMHDILTDSRLWDFDAVHGLLRLNIRHPLWSKCDDKGPNAVMRFQEYLIAQALTVWGVEESLQEPLRHALENEAATMAFIAANGDTIAGRNLVGRKRREAERETPAKRPAKSLAFSKK